MGPETKLILKNPDKKYHPPRLARRFLRWYCREDLLDEVEGDLQELFERRVREQRIWKARLLYCLNILMFLHPDYIRKRKYYPTNHTAMFKNYLLVAIRNAFKHKFYATINVLGLAIGMTCCLLLFLYVSQELNYDAFHSKSDRIYRLVTDIKTPTETLNIGETSSPMAVYMKSDFPEVENIVRLDEAQFLLQKDGQTFQEDNAMLADSTFFQVFSFNLLSGNPNTALEAPFSLVLTKSAATKYFGNEDPLGQRLILENEYDCTITGVMENVPENSSFDFDMLISLSTRLEAVYPQATEQWGNFMNVSYVLLAEQADPDALESKLPDFLSKYISEQDRSEGMDYTLHLEPLSDVYFSERGGFKTGSMINVKIFAVIALFILLIACINFMNLATARATERAKEVGIRKVIGAVRRQLTTQFLFESILLSMVAVLIAVLLSELLLPIFNQLAGKQVAISVLNNGNHLAVFFISALIIGLLAGLYPALVLSRFGSAAILKGRFSSSRRGIVLRKLLVVTQFAISMVLIVGTLVIYVQLDYMQNQALGFKKDQMLVIDFQGDDAIDDRTETFKEQLLDIPGVVSASASSSVPSQTNSHAYSEIENPEGDMQASNVNLFYVDDDFLNQYQMKVAAGRFFSDAFSTDSSAMIVNETLAKSYGYASPQDIIGKKFSQWGVEGEIIGVVKDYHFRSLQQEIAPMTIRMSPQFARYFTLTIQPDNLTNTLAELTDKWQDLAPQRPLDFFFVNESFDQLYRTEARFGQLFIYFASLAIFIACLGLLGLISYTVMQRTREIGVRKVLGATEQSIVRLLSADFLTLLLIAFVIATPIAWYTLQQWLSNFAYRTTIPWWVFALAGLTATLIAMLTISFQAIKAAIANPVDSLRSE